MNASTLTPDLVFRIANTAALLGWLLLAFAPLARRPITRITGYVLPVCLAILYVLVLALHWGEAQGGFGTLSEVAALFANRWILLGGWVHYLAFDLFIGTWEVRDAGRTGVPHAAVVPCLILTFLFGPAGLLAYLISRALRASGRNLDLHEAPVTAH